MAETFYPMGAGVPSAPIGWQPIETAPSDGGEFIVWDDRALKWGVCFKSYTGEIVPTNHDSALPRPTFDEFGHDPTAFRYWMRPPSLL